MPEIRIQDYLRDTGLVQSRLILSALAIIALSVLLIWRLYDLQIIQNQEFNTLSQENRIRVVPLPPVRGQIYDRNGVLLAQNLPVHTLEVRPDRVEDIEKMFEEVSRLVVLDDEDVEDFRHALKTRPSFETQMLKVGLTEAEAARFAASQHLIAGVELKARQRRHYPLGPEMVHVLGYVGRISEADLERIDKAAYKGTDYIGKLGIEARYENQLFGEVGYEEVETNAHGQVVRKLSRKQSVAGKDLYLSVDSNLQRAAREYLGDFWGSVVAVEPKTGEILAFVSNPIYDPNPFVEGIDNKSYQALRQDEGRPLLNRALHGRYPPGSTIKPFFGMAALEYGVNPNTTTFCPGFYRLRGSTRRYRCWKRHGHGPMNLHNAIVQSCDVYFYSLAHTLGINKLSDFMLRFGMGKQTQVDLYDEPAGLAPNPEWKKEARGEPWWPGETVITGIGQGYVLVTPLQLAMATATLANQGARMEPHLMKSMVTPATNVVEPHEPVMLDQVQVRSQAHYQPIFQAMHDVVHGVRGTARRSGAGAEYIFGGKTGTAQVIGIAQGETYKEENVAKKFRDHALFISFAPIDDPKIAVAVVAENGGGGSRTAAPIARKVMDYYLVGPPPPEETTETDES